MKKLISLLTAALMLLLTAANAMPVTLLKGSEGFEAVNMETGETAALDTVSFQLLGRSGDGGYILFYDGAFYTAPLTGLVTGGMGLPSADDLETLSRGSRGDAVAVMQAALKALGYLSGSADGDFGKKSEQAVSDFQKDMDITVTGEADALTQMLLISMTAEPWVQEEPADPSKPFEAIRDRVTIDMAPIYESGLTLDYDDMEGEGLISDGSVITSSGTSGADIDRYSLEVRIGLCVRDEGAEVRVQPGLVITCTSMRRLMLQDVVLKAGDKRVTVNVTESATALSGAETKETDVVLLDAEAAEVLKNAAEAGELRLRLHGKYQSYDVESADPAYAALVGQLAG
ncbi:MAG: peptidoglycan-binding protein [Clostridia bacterium]|nr:peptidoglycan-binding protein [Clostridia bacterium]